jgi:hypothetical protein
MIHSSTLRYHRNCTYVRGARVTVILELVHKRLL